MKNAKKLLFVLLAIGISLMFATNSLGEKLSIIHSSKINPENLYLAYCAENKSEYAKFPVLPEDIQEQGERNEIDEIATKAFLSNCNLTRIVKQKIGSVSATEKKAQEMGIAEKSIVIDPLTTKDKLP